MRKEREAKEGVRARFYPTTGGILKSMQEETGYRYMAVDGTENCMAMLEELQTGEFDKVFIEMSACEGSCINGPSIREHRQSRLKGNLRVDVLRGRGRFRRATPLKDISQQFAFRSTHSVHARAARPSRPCSTRWARPRREQGAQLRLLRLSTPAATRPSPCARARPWWKCACRS